MTDSLTIFGTTYTGVTGIIATDTSDTDKTYIRPQGTKSISANGTGIDVAAYASVDVNVPTGGSSNTFVVHLSKVNDVWTPDCTYSQLYEAYQADKEIAWEIGEGNPNATGEWGYVEEQNLFYYTVIEADVNYTAKFYSISANGVSSDGSEVGYITTDATASPSDVAQGKTFYNANGKQTGTASGSSINNQNKTVTPTTSQQTVTADSGYTGLGTVTVNAMPSGTEGTPTATKGTVSNHAISVTPSVTNSAGYISGGTHTGTAVSVSASELVSGTLSITSSGTKDVTNYASASVASGGATASATKGTVTNHSVTVTPSVTRTAGYVTAGTASGTAVTVSASELVSGSETKTANGTYDVTNLASLVVAIPLQHIYTGTSAPSSSLGSNGDVYIQTA